MTSVPSPGRLRISKDPPATSARSRIITDPKCPSGAGARVSKPEPSSRIWTSTPSSESWRSIQMWFGSACLSAFSTASRAIW